MKVFRTCKYIDVCDHYAEVRSCSGCGELDRFLQSLGPKPTNSVIETKRECPRFSKIKNVIFNDPATIVFWEDGTKTVVKCQDGDVFDPWKGLSMAISKKALGNKGNYCNELKKWVEPYYDELKIESEFCDINLPDINAPISLRKIIINAKKTLTDYLGKS